MVRKTYETMFVCAPGLLGLLFATCVPPEDMESAPEASTGAEEEDPPGRSPPPVAGVYIAIADQARVPGSFEVLDVQGVPIVAGDKPTVLLIETPELPYRFAVRPRDNANPLVRLEAIVTHPGCHGVFMTERPSGDDDDGMATTFPAFVPSLGPPLDTTRWLFNLGPVTLFIHEDEPHTEAIATLLPGEGSALADVSPRWLRVGTSPHDDTLRWWALETPHTMLLADEAGHVRHLGIEGQSACRVVAGGVATPVEPPP